MRNIESKKILVHGTTKKAALRILKEGFCEREASWFESEPGKTYFIDLDEVGGLEDAISPAFFHGCFSSFVRKEEGPVVTLFFEVPEDLLSELGRDTSSEYEIAKEMMTVSTENLLLVGVAETEISAIHGIYAYLMKKDMDIPDWNYEKREFSLVRSLQIEGAGYELLHEEALRYKWRTVNDFLNLSPDENPEDLLAFYLSDFSETDLAAWGRRGTTA